MAFDERPLESLIEQSHDAQFDAMRRHHEVLGDLADVREERRGEEVDPGEAARFDAVRRSLADDLGLADGGWARKGVLAGALGSALAALLTAPAAADTNLDIQILQTATSLEILTVSTYRTALTRPFYSGSGPAIIRFTQETMQQHDEHRQAFQAQTKALGGKVQQHPNPKYTLQVDNATPILTLAVQVTKLAATLEQVATDTYLAALPLLTDTRTKALMASVMGVEAQHLAILRTMTALFDAGASDLIVIPADAATLPATAGSVGFPNAFEGTTLASPPSEGAVL
jgi:hypothetical protein